MARIDVSTIEGFDTMSAEDQVKALLGFEYSDGATEIKKYKDAMDKANTESANRKREIENLKEQLKSKMSDEELKAKESEEATKALKEELATLRKEKALSDATAKYVALGYDAELAKEASLAIVNGDTEKTFEIHKQFNESLVKKTIADYQMGTPHPAQGGKSDGSAINKEQFNNMGYAERLELFNTNPALYEELNGGN